MGKYRRAYHCGSWYSNDKNELENSIDTFFKKANLKKKKIKAAICPHAGYNYSLETNSHVYACINLENIKNIFILGPNHHIYNDKCLFPKVENYETPFGFLMINTDIISEIVENDTDNLFGFINKIDDEEEHSIEMQLPLTKYIVKEKEIKIIPIYVGCIGSDIKRIELFCKPLKRYFENDENMFLFSSDFCHYGQRFSFTSIMQKYNDKYICNQIENMDKDAVDIITKHDISAFIEYLNTTHNTICGSNPIKIMLKLIQSYPGNVLTQLMHYSQSNKVKRANESSVSYAGIVSIIE